MTAISRGYVALISTLVTSFVLMAVAVLAGESGFRAMTNTLNLENRLVAAHAARSCASIALLLVAQDGSYDLRDGSEEVDVSENLTCVIEEAREEGGSFSVQGSAGVGGSVGRVRTEGTLSSSSTFLIRTWTEI